MQHLELGKQLKHYHRHIQDDHDFNVWAEVLTMEERPTRDGKVDVLDGQINFARGDDGPERTASVLLSDPEEALSFGTSFSEDPTGTLWVNRLVRIRHAVVVPELGRVATTCIVGVPTAVSRRSGEIALELGDKSLLADHGVRPKTYSRGTNVRDALVSILRDLTGEHHLRIPNTKKKLSRLYTVGMGDETTTPWRVARRIAAQEMGWRLYFSADGFATAEPSSRKGKPVQVRHVLALPDSSASFGDFSNYVKVTSRRTPSNRERKKNDIPTSVSKILFDGVATLPAEHRLSEQSLARNGVPRTLPLLVGDDSLKSKKQVATRAREELRKNSDIEVSQAYEIIPMFHLDKGDRLELPMGIGVVDFDEASIPLGTGGNMTLGEIRWVSRPVKVKRVRTRRRVKHKKKGRGDE